MFIDFIIGSLHEIFIIFVLYNIARNTTRNNISKKRQFHLKFYRKTEVTFSFLATNNYNSTIQTTDKTQHCSHYKAFVLNLIYPLLQLS